MAYYDMANSGKSSQRRNTEATSRSPSKTHPKSHKKMNININLKSQN